MIEQDNVREGTVAKRLLGYLLLFRRQVAVALLILVLALGAQLAGPIVTKTIIDDHLLAIQFDWYELESEDVPEGALSVPFRERAYVRSDWLPEGAPPPAPESVARFRAGAGDGDGSGFALDSPAYGVAALTGAEVTAFYRHDIAPIFRLVALIVALTVVGSALTYVQSFLLQSSAQRIVQRMRMDLFRHLQRLPVAFFDKTPIGQIVSRVANDTENIKELYISFTATFVVSGLNIIGVFAALLFLEWRLALLCAIILPLFAALLYLHLKISKKYVQIIRAKLAEMNAMLNEMIHVMPIVQAFRREETMKREFGRLNEERYRSQVAQFRITAFSGRNVVYFVSRLLTAFILWYFGARSLGAGGVVSFGALYAFVDYLGRIYEPIVGIFDQMTNAQRAFVSAERVFALMDREGEAVEEEEGPATPRPEGRVEFDDVTFAYVPGENVLKGISFEAKRGETIALVGHTGSGKSSIMNLLLGFYEPTGGAIRIDGVDIRTMSKQALRRHMGIVLQDPFLFTGDVKFNVSLYNEAIDEETARRALTEVGAGPFVDRLANGLAEPVVERGSTMSAGERQLVSFARALAYDPAILILDEATASIDSETEQVIQHALNVLRHGRTTFVIAHRLSTIRDADRILVLNRGVIEERGTHDELMALRGRYYRMYLLQNAERPVGAG
ncbi:ABC transporter ATP-binding protein [Paenibacillus antri]|uniref:ABC transporter ATP-binding protein n=1 Tax=Paenibacillus antri TaxID=2582848 RepID=A0A5R9G7F3_9BACL|nr:ABC transporter ATP-binding protein [Paenibacillus antri]TLS51009.1 ABC transporter ATP-binding protein [Paenibacillus antri]